MEALAGSPPSIRWFLGRCGEGRRPLGWPSGTPSSCLCFPKKPGSSHAPGLKGRLPLPTVSGAPGDHGMVQLEKGRFVAVPLGGGKEMEPKHQTQKSTMKENQEKKTPLRAQGCGEESLTSSSHRSRRKMNPLLRLESILYPGLGGKKKGTWCFQKTLCQSVQPGRE